ncbi:MAG: polyribonucleotide nucleotidyltransferase, partial [bacterium]
MQEKKMFEFQLGDPSAGSGQVRKLEVKIGGLAEQASGCCLIRYGDTSILCTAMLGKSNPGQGFFPLTCDYEERFYAAGKILGSRFIRREGRPSTEAVLTSRLIDRAVRPLFPKELTNEVQVIATCLSWDAENDPSTLGLLGASLVLGMSEIPWNGPVAVVRIGHVEDKFILNPTYEQREKGNLDLVLAGIEKNGEILINMIESGAEEISEEIFINAYDFAKPFLKDILDFQKKVLKEIAKPKAVIASQETDYSMIEKVKNYLSDKLETALYEPDKQKRNYALEALQEQMFVDLAGEIGESSPVRGEASNGASKGFVKNFFEEQVEKSFKENILSKDKRPDGRG